MNGISHSESLNGRADCDKGRGGVTPPLRARRSLRGRWGMIGLGALLLVGLGGLFAVGLLPRLQSTQALNAAAAAKAAATPIVQTAVATRAPADAQRELPGNCLPLYEAALFARATGYLSERRVDIGDRVEEGQLLANISSPDVDDQLAQAQADLAQAEANLKLNQANYDLAKITLSRDVQAGNVAVPAQQVDQDRATLGTTEASVKAAQAAIGVNKASVQRYADLQSFEKIQAPFHGVITVRNYDKGALITADDPTTLPLFRLAQIDVVRVFVNVPQVFASGIQDGQYAEVYRREDPNRKYSGRVTRTANSLDPNTRTLLTEVDVPNPDGALLPGMYLQVNFNFPRLAPTVMVPSAAITFRADGAWVGVLDERNAVHYQKVQTGRDFGTEMEVLDGLNEGAAVIVRPGDELADGTAVQPADPAKSN
ncbi:MAG TPA: efflux RND transporter periplasmic adaptor subunit [Gemmataceae bacterium]|nr:efflux RND transporter periplasmic adaptor subunit [Gemmataceae bacterium]